MRNVATSQTLAQRDAFEAELKHSLDIKEFYTSLTGEAFLTVKGRLRARNVWRNDNEPSLAYYDDQPHVLTDFGESWEGGKPRTYDALDILIATQNCLGKREAVEWLCDRQGRPFPHEIYSGEKGSLALTAAIRQVWAMCRDEMDRFLESGSHVEVGDYFARRDIPPDPLFVGAVNLGLCPDVSLLAQAIGDTTDKGPPPPEYSKRSIAYPLYNKAGALAGVKFRLAAEKGFNLWSPTERPCHFNFQRFPRRPHGARLQLVEGESNVVAYAVAVHREGLARRADDLAKWLDDGLYTIYCTGSKTERIADMRGGFPSVLYFPDYDDAEVNKYTDLKRHPVFETVMKVSGVLESNDFMVMDWAQLGDVYDKFDLADYLKGVDYDITRLRALKTTDIYGLGTGIIERIAADIGNGNNSDATKLRMLGDLNALLDRPQSYVMEGVGGAGAPKAPQSVPKRALAARWHTYSIDKDGHIVQAIYDKAGEFVEFREVANFYIQIKNIVAEYDVYTRCINKYYRLDLMREGRLAGGGLAKVEEVVDVKKFHAFVARIGDIHSCKCEPKDWSAVMGLMNVIPPELNVTAMTALGRPPFEEEMERLVGGTRYCLMPCVSVVRGAITCNREIDVSLQNHDELQAKTRFQYRWRTLTDAQAREAAGLFWDHLLNVHSMHIMTSLAALIYDGATREMMGDGSVVPNGHGFPIYLAGVSGSHKTTAAIYAMNLLGEFNEQHDLFDWQNTANYIETLFMKCGTMVAAMDELKNELFTTEDFVRIFNSLYGGSTKGRMTASASATGDVKVSCSAIITSETHPFRIPESIASRIIIFRVPRSSAAVAAARKKHMDALDELMDLEGRSRPKRHMLHGLLPRMVSWEQTRPGQPYVEALKKWRAHYQAKVVGVENSYRTVHMVTRLVSAFERMCRFLVECGYVPQRDADARLAEYARYWDEGVVAQALQVRDRSSKTNIAKYLGELVESKRIEMAVFSDGRWDYYGNTSKGVVLLDVTYPDEGRKILIVAPHGLFTSLNQLSGSTDVSDRFFRDGEESGLIEPEPRQPPPGCRFCLDGAMFKSIDHTRLMAEYNLTKVPTA